MHRSNTAGPGHLETYDFRFGRLRPPGSAKGGHFGSISSSSSPHGPAARCSSGLATAPQYPDTSPPRVRVLLTAKAGHLNRRVPALPFRKTRTLRIEGRLDAAPQNADRFSDPCATPSAGRPCGGRMRGITARFARPQTADVCAPFLDATFDIHRHTFEKAGRLLRSSRTRIALSH